MPREEKTNARSTLFSTVGLADLFQMRFWSLFSRHYQPEAFGRLKKFRRDPTRAGCASFVHALRKQIMEKLAAPMPRVATFFCGARGWICTNLSLRIESASLPTPPAPSTFFGDHLRGGTRAFGQPESIPQSEFDEVCRRTKDEPEGVFIQLPQQFSLDRRRAGTRKVQNGAP